MGQRCTIDGTVLNIVYQNADNGYTVLRMTTGSTMGECCRILRENGARSVFCAAVAGGRKVAKTDENAYCKS